MSIIPSSFFSSRRRNTLDPFSPFDLWCDPFKAGILPFAASGDTAAFAGARVDWKETPEFHVFKADLPGLRKEEVKVEMEGGGVLVISGERSRERAEETDKWHRVERSSGRFLRRFRLPENAKADEVKASIEDGVLTVIVPKA